MNFDAGSDEVRRWFYLAFQDDVERIRTFVNHLALRASHLEEVLAGMETRAPKVGVLP
jgi:hypothetical protein